MPTHKGIELSIVSQWGLRVHPEFPHPESSQFHQRKGDDVSGPDRLTDSKANRFLGRVASPSIASVYIPSVADTRFFVRYNIVEGEVEHAQWYYFKLFMNGRHITSWGINSKKRPRGQAMRALFVPQDRELEEYEQYYTNYGTEVRPFFFSKELLERSIAGDGGLIEVQVYRARGRKRRIPRLEEFRDQERYGIDMPNAGLLTRPEDAKFYDWILRDPKGSPWATFNFHYRTWNNLVNLQIVSSTHPQELLDNDFALEEINQELSRFQDLLDGNDNSAIDSDGEISVTQALDPWMSNVFDESSQEEESDEEAEALMSDAMLTKKKHRSAFIITNEKLKAIYPNSDDGEHDNSLQDTEQASKVMDDGTEGGTTFEMIDLLLADHTSGPSSENLIRPLPPIPLRDSHTSSTQIHLDSRSSSAASQADSITPSLLTYLERETSSPEPEIGVASVVPLPFAHASSVTSYIANKEAGPTQTPDMKLSLLLAGRMMKSPESTRDHKVRRKPVPSTALVTPLSPRAPEARTPLVSLSQPSQTINTTSSAFVLPPSSRVADTPTPVSPLSPSAQKTKTPQPQAKRRTFAAVSPLSEVDFFPNITLRKDRNPSSTISPLKSRSPFSMSRLRGTKDDTPKPASHYALPSVSIQTPTKLSESPSREMPHSISYSSFTGSQNESSYLDPYANLTVSTSTGKGDENVHAKVRSLSLTEAQWMSPSPARKDGEKEKVRIAKWSPVVKGMEGERKTFLVNGEGKVPDSPSSVYEEDDLGRPIEGAWF